MNETITIPQRNYSNRNTYRGQIEYYDFETGGTTPGAAIDRILYAWRFDEQCKRDCKLRGWL